MTTAFIAEEYPDGFQGAVLDEATLEAHRARGGLDDGTSGARGSGKFPANSAIGTAVPRRFAVQIGDFNGR